MAVKAFSSTARWLCFALLAGCSTMPAVAQEKEHADHAQHGETYTTPTLAVWSGLGVAASGLVLFWYRKRCKHRRAISEKPKP